MLIFTIFHIRQNGVLKINLYHIIRSSLSFTYVIRTPQKKSVRTTAAPSMNKIQQHQLTSSKQISAFNFKSDFGQYLAKKSRQNFILIIITKIGLQIQNN